MFPADKNNRLDELANRLDQGNLSSVRLKRSKLSNPSLSAPTEWPEELVADYGERGDSRTWLWLKRLLIGSSLFFVLAVAIALFIFFSGSNLISNNRIDLSITGPISLKAGEEANWQLTIINRNKSTLQSARLLLDYPPGTRSSKNIQQELIHESISLSDIKPGAMVNQTARAFVFGPANSQSTIKATLEYRLANSSAVFTKDLDYNFTINDSPINLSLALPTEINSGRDLTLDLKIISNSSTILTNVLLAINYPPGFSFRSASLPPTKDNNVWSLGDLPVGIEKHLVIQGVLDGQDEELKTFQTTIGLADSQIVDKMSVVYNKITQSIAIRRPFVGLNLSLGNQANPGDSSVFSSGESIPGQLSWINNTPNLVRNLKIKLALVGPIYDRRSVNANDGFYRSTDETIIWDKSLIEGLAVLKPGDSANASFSFSLLPSSALQGALANNPQLEIIVIIEGERITDDNQSEALKTEIHKIVRLRSAINLATKTSYQSGPFTNSGPLPPKVNEKTTYTLTWSLTNPSNNLSNVQVKTVLPPYITWLDTSSPQIEKLTYSEKDHSLIWDLGLVPAGTGFNIPIREVSFQIGLVPSLSQLNRSPNLSGSIELSGVDNFTGTKVQLNYNPLTTQASDGGGATSSVVE
ncbi:MAG: hypothetical protein COX02_02380 [Candidatus Vogelbacteria bacterium CG22_combo_CG10-13_8_21_14_all_37_9]|uniref:DUF11 domain-containing protein n=1 Tax=Candidatus Vogelbacteria bacterium CG22_combo_CG10-13_8_21_14_all_37_9 TaxID=1975046 RepID=A0A2H0BK46_9BACT|nr:MAG: hypothetical protein COX02_02380 [Candidatus Vogelbacteria bacterium CG22_combo_CG10-13_8_21_14_all_37_9]